MGKAVKKWMQLSIFTVKEIAQDMQTIHQLASLI